MEDSMAGRRSGSAGRQGKGSTRTNAAARDAAIAAAMGLFAARGWQDTTLAGIAEAAGIDFPELHALFPSKTAVLRAFLSGVDRTVLATAPENGSSVREALFELMMRRFDALQPHRDAFQRLARDLPRDPAAAACVAMRVCRSIAAIAERAGVATTGPLGAMRIKALAGLHAWVVRAWLADDSTDMARTMKALDQGLERLEAIAQSFPGARPLRTAA
jgi:AcrR family transcriptional regulator